MTKKTVRILRQLPVDGVLYQPDQLVAFEKEAANEYIKAGAADGNKAAVAHCKEQGVELITHADTAEAKAAKEAADAEAKAAQEAADAEGTSSDDEASGD